MTGPTAPADIRSGLTVTWTSQGNADLTFVGLEGYDGLWGTVSGRVDDTGSFTVPAAGLGAGRIVAIAVAGAMFRPAP